MICSTWKLMICCSLRHTFRTVRRCIQSHCTSKVALISCCQRTHYVCALVRSAWSKVNLIELWSGQLICASNGLLLLSVILTCVEMNIICCYVRVKLIQNYTEHLNRMVSSPALYSGGTSFKSWPGGRLH